MAVTAMKPKNAVESLREVVQDLLVPELKALKVSVESLREEVKTKTDSLRQEVKMSGDLLKSSDDSLRAEIQALAKSLRNEMQLRDEKQSQAIQALSDKLGYAIDIRERLAVLEDRVPRS